MVVLFGKLDFSRKSSQDNLMDTSLGRRGWEGGSGGHCGEPGVGVLLR